MVPSDVSDEFLKANRVAAGSQVPLIRVNFGLAVRADAPRPDTSTPDALRKTFLAAKRVLITDPATGGISGVHLMEVLNKLGIVEEMKDKLVPNRGSGHHAERVVKGEADLAVQAEHEIRCVPGAAFLDYPKELQRSIVFIGGVGAATTDAAAAEGLSRLRHRTRGRAGDQGEMPVAGHELRTHIRRETRYTGETMTHLRFIAAALVAAFTLAAGAAQAEVRTEWVEYTHAGAKLKGYLAYDDKIKGKRPAILMIHDRAGMQPYAQKQAENWAKLGYVVVRRRLLRLRPGHPAEGRSGGGGADGRSTPRTAR